MRKYDTPELHGQYLAEQINDELNKTWKARDDYRAACEAAVSLFESVLAGLDADDK